MTTHNPWKALYEAALADCRLMAAQEHKPEHRLFHQGVAAAVDTFEIYRLRLEDKQKEANP